MVQLFDIIQKLRSEYNRGALVPVIGAGFSMPFELPNWTDLLLSVCTEFQLENHQIESVCDLCKNGDYVRAVDSLIGFTKSTRTDKDIQNVVSKLLSDRINSLKVKNNVDSLSKASIDNNYKDIFDYNFHTVLTLNYDEILSEYSSKNFYQNTMTSFTRTQQIGNEDNIIYVHGRISEPSSIILAKSNYQAIYTSENFKNKFAALTLNRTFLFLGFSFRDEYMRRFLELVIKDCDVMHYALIDSTSVRELGEEQIKVLNEKYHIKIIQYDDSEKKFTGNIRKFLKIITRATPESSIPQDIFSIPISYKDSGRRYLSHTSVYTCLQNNLIKILKLSTPKAVLELGFGGSQIAVRVAEEISSLKITVVNNDYEMLKTAKCIIEEKSLSNIKLIERDACEYVKSSLSQYDFVFLLYNFHHIKDSSNQKREKEEFLRHCYDNMKEGSYLCIADIFLPELCDESRLESDKSLRLLYQQRAEEYKASTFWSFLNDISHTAIFRTLEEAEQSKIRESESAVKVKTKDGEYLIKKSWLLEKIEELGFEVIIDQFVNNIADAILLVKKN